MKTAISMPDDLYQAVIDYACGKKFSTTVCNLIRLALPVEGNVVPYNNESVIPLNESQIHSMFVEIENAVILNKDKIQEVFHQVMELQNREKYTNQDLVNIDERVRHLEANLVVLATRMTNPQSLEVKTTHSSNPQFQSPDFLSSKEECSQSIKKEDLKSSEKSITKVQTEVVLDEKKILTEEMRLTGKEKIEILRKNGKTYADISKLTGIGESMLKKLGNGYSVKMVPKRGFDILIRAVT
nr:hypothetical protein [uncultured Methanospirillum sp.]